MQQSVLSSQAADGMRMIGQTDMKVAKNKKQEQELGFYEGFIT
jgi:hypothetical protein